MPLYWLHMHAGAAGRNCRPTPTSPGWVCRIAFSASVITACYDLPSMKAIANAVWSRRTKGLPFPAQISKRKASTTRRLTPIAAALTLFTGSAVAHRRTYPSQSIKMIVPFAAGGPTDTVGRPIAEPMTRTFCHQVLIENIADAGGALSAARAARAEPDRTSIGWITPASPGAREQVPTRVWFRYALRDLPTARFPGRCGHEIQLECWSRPRRLPRISARRSRVRPWRL
jgi:hypothetical protein